MIWANNIDATSALHHEIADRWHHDAAERRALRLAFGGTATQRI